MEEGVLLKGGAKLQKIKKSLVYWIRLYYNKKRTKTGYSVACSHENIKELKMNIICAISNGGNCFGTQEM